MSVVAQAGGVVPDRVMPALDTLRREVRHTLRSLVAGRLAAPKYCGVAAQVPRGNNVRRGPASRRPTTRLGADRADLGQTTHGLFPHLQDAEPLHFGPPRRLVKRSITAPLGGAANASTQGSLVE